MRPSFLWHPSSDPADRGRIQAESLLRYCKNVYSQRGDDGIIGQIFKRLRIETGFFIEFGGWDGLFSANSRALFEDGWGGTFIEADRKKFEELQRNYADQDQIICINEWVGIPGYPGRPKVVCIEGGFAWHPSFTMRVSDEVASKNLQQPLSVMIDIGRAAGYVPVCFNQNLYLVQTELAGPFTSIQNDSVTLWRDAWFNESDEFRADLIRIRAESERIRGEEGPDFVTIPVSS